MDLFLELDYAHVFKWQMLKSMDVAFAQQQDFGAMGENEAEMIKRIFIESNPYFLVRPPRRLDCVPRLLTHVQRTRC